MTEWELVSIIRDRGRLRCRTGVLLIPEAELGRERELAARLNIDCVDMAEHVNNSLPEETEFVPPGAAYVLRWLRDIANAESGGDCVLVSNVDLLLARLEEQQRETVWRQLCNNFPNYRRGIIITLPAKGVSLLMSRETQDVWRKTRMAEMRGSTV